MQLGSGYPGSSASGGGAEGGSQIPLTSRLPSGAPPQETDIGGYRSHLSTASHYGTQYGSVYGTSSLASSQPLSSNTKGVVLGSSVLDNRSGYVPALPDSPPKYGSGSYLSSSSAAHGYGQKEEDLYSDKLSGYVPVDRRQSGGYLGRELQSDPAARYADSSSFGRQVPLTLTDNMNLVCFSV